MAMGMLGKLFGVAVMGIGAYLAGEHVVTVADGARLAANGVERTVRVEAKRVEPRPESGRTSGMIGVSSEGGQGARVQSPKTLLRSYLLDVSFLAESGRETALAPVSYARYLEQRPGMSISVTALPGIAYVDATPRATLLYGLKKIAFGALMIVVGLVVMLLPDNDDEDKDIGSGHDIDPADILRRARDPGL